jgi:hypothetical protein
MMKSITSSCVPSALLSAHSALVAHGAGVRDSAIITVHGATYMLNPTDTGRPSARCDVMGGPLRATEICYPCEA